MWCPNCESEVATEVAADGQSLLCVSCRNQIRRLSTPSLHPDIRRARDILSRLSAATSTPDEQQQPVGPENEPVELDDVLIAASSAPEPAQQPPAKSAPPKQFRVEPPASRGRYRTHAHQQRQGAVRCHTRSDTAIAAERRTARDPAGAAL